jgi:membrane protease YdiL (CAAX protease family)
MFERGLRPTPWSEAAVVLGIWLAIFAYLVPRILIGPTAALLGAGTHYTDVGDVFEKAGKVAGFADLALARASAGNPIPDPPRILGDVTAARVAWVYAIGSLALFGAVAVGVTRRGTREFVRATGLDRFDFDRLWEPGLAVAIVYLLAGFYSRVVDHFGIGILQTDPGGLEVTLRDSWALALYGVTTVLAAPLGEELFYRGLVFGGLTPWGFLPAALVSSVLFAVSHLDPGTLVPFTLVGLTVSWLYWRSGSLWDAIAFHFLFNLLTFILLLART